jgi:hypothetical protein
MDFIWIKQTLAIKNRFLIPFPGFPIYWTEHTNIRKCRGPCVNASKTQWTQDWTVGLFIKNTGFLLEDSHNEGVWFDRDRRITSQWRGLDRALSWIGAHPRPSDHRSTASETPMPWYHPRRTIPIQRLHFQRKRTRTRIYNQDHPLLNQRHGLDSAELLWRINHNH